MEKVKLETNVPVELAFKYDSGKPVNGQFGDQVLYTTVDDRALYADPSLARAIEGLGVGRGEVVILCKKEVRAGNRKSIEYQAWLPGQAAPGLGPRPAAPEATALVSAPRTAVAAPAAAPVAAPVPTVPMNGNGDSALDVALRFTIDALDRAEKYAATKGMSIRFEAEDVRTMANTTLINMGKGGGAWKQ